MGHGDSENSTALYVARQAILDERGKLFGYELLYRGAASDTACAVEGNVAGARVLTSAVLDLGLDTLTGGRRAFLNLTAPLLDCIADLVPPDGVVLELLESIEVTSDLIEACRHLKQKGYLLALDDFVWGSGAEALVPHVSFVKVDVLSTPIEEVARLAERLRPGGVTMLAEKVEDRQVYDRTRQVGYGLFQGYYFCKPVLQHGTGIPAQKLVYLRLLAAIHKPDLGTLELEALVKQDVSLSLRVLRFANSAAVPTRAQIATIRQALILIGVEPIRKWASVWCLAGLNMGATSELSTMALVRARVCEIIGQRLPGMDASELYLVGLCSLLDVMLSRTMSDALEGLSLSDTVTGALLGQQNAARAVLDAVIAYESGAWEEAVDRAERANVAPSLMPEAYTTALRWARTVTAGLAPSDTGTQQSVRRS